MRTIAHGYFFEGPRWHADRFYVSDFFAHTVTAYTLDGDAELIATIPNRPSGLGFMPNGDLLVASMRDRSVYRVHDGIVRKHADLSSIAGGDVNDMLVDAHGGAYVGNFGFDLFSGAAPQRTSLAYIDPNGTARVVAGELFFPNGMALADGGATLLVAESFARRITAFTIAPDGALGDRRSWAHFTDVSPDGIALDAAGDLWIADARGRRALHVREGGEVLREIAPGDGTFAVALGGTERQTLLLCVAPNFDEYERSGAPAARLLTIQL